METGFFRLSLGFVPPTTELERIYDQRVSPVYRRSWHRPGYDRAKPSRGRVKEVVAPVELSDYLRVLRTRWVGVFVLFVVGITAAAGWSLLQPRVYTADASGYVAAQGATDLGTSMVGDQLAQSKVKSYLDIGTWRAVAEYAISELKLNTTPEALVKQVSVTNPTNTVILQVSASASTPEAARDLAEVWIRGIIKQVDQIEGANGKTPPVTVIPGDSARLPTSPSSPNWKLNLALGALAGLLLGVGYAVVRDRMDQHIRSDEQVENATGLAVVGTLPLESSLATTLTVLPPADARSRHGLVALTEAFRGLRTNLQYMSVDDPPRAIVVTSSLPGDGKSFTAANLAMTIATAGQKVVLIDGDLRRPRVASLFGLPEGAGLSDVLAGRAQASDVLQAADPRYPIQVLAAGRVPPNPSEILGSERMRQLIADLSEDALVIIDSPPLLPVTDAAVLSTRSDGALVVVSTGKTTFAQLDRALQLLEKARAKPLGIVLNRVPTSGSGAAQYGYQYTGDYYSSHGHSGSEAADADEAIVPEPAKSDAPAGERLIGA